MNGRIPKCSYVRMGLITLALVAMLVYAYLHLNSWDLSSNRGVSSTEHTTPIEQSLEDRPPKMKSELNVSLPDEVSSGGSKQYKAWENLVAEIQYGRQQRVSQKCGKKSNLSPKLPLSYYTRGWVVDRGHKV